MLNNYSIGLLILLLALQKQTDTAVYRTGNLEQSENFLSKNSSKFREFLDISYKEAHKKNNKKNRKQGKKKQWSDKENILWVFTFRHGIFDCGKENIRETSVNGDDHIDTDRSNTDPKSFEELDACVR